MELAYPRFTMQKINYIHNNPVKDGIVDRPEAYVYSSAANYLGHPNTNLHIEVLDLDQRQGLIIFINNIALHEVCNLVPI